MAHECDAIVVLKAYGMRLLESPPLVMTHLTPPRMNITPGLIYIYNSTILRGVSIVWVWVYCCTCGTNLSRILANLNEGLYSLNLFIFETTTSDVKMVVQHVAKVRPYTLLGFRV